MYRVRNKNLFSQRIFDKGLDRKYEVRKIGFSMECFTADFFQFFPKNVRIWLFG